MNPQEYKEALVAYEKYKQSGAELTHWGISGMKWGRRRWQNEDGSLTEEGRIHYGVSKKVKTVGEAREQAKANARATRVATKQAEHDAKFQAKLENQKKIAEAQAKTNEIKLKDPNTGKFLELTDINSGTYYDYLKSLIEESLNNFLLDTTFPYTPDERPGPGPGPAAGWRCRGR